MKIVPTNHLPPALQASTDALIKRLIAEHGEPNVQSGMVMHNAAGFFHALDACNVPPALMDYAARLLGETIAEMGMAIGADPEKAAKVAQALIANSRELAAELRGGPRDDAAKLDTVAAEAAAVLRKAGWTPRVIDGGARPEDIN